jgi:5-methylcytosine-specific restriction protein A
VASLPKRPCRGFRCRNLTDSKEGFCPTCQRDKYKRIDANRGTPSQRGYDSDWRKLRTAKLSSYPLCEINTHCRHPTVATEVDHKVPIAERPELRLDFENLQSACHACHSAKTLRESVSR